MARGNIKQRSPGTWSIRVELSRDPFTGKRRQKRLTFDGTKRAAEVRLSQLLTEINQGSYINSPKDTVGQYLVQWLQNNVWPYLAPKTAQNYEHMVNKHLIPGIGHVRLSQLNCDHIQRYIADKLGSGLKAKTVRHHYVTLHTAMVHAVEEKKIGRNPCESVKPPRPDLPEMRVLDEDEMHMVLEGARSTEYYALFYFMLYTGCRRSEALALRWRDVDLLLSQVSINRSLHHLRDGRIIFRQPKTTKSRRLVSLPPSASIVLRQHREQQMVRYQELDMGVSADDLVFCKMDGKPYLPDTITHVWIKLTRKLGLDGIRLHDARHTHATLMLKQGVHPKVVQERLGHNSITVTIDTYSHLVPGMQEAAALKFDDGVRREQRKIA